MLTIRFENDAERLKAVYGRIGPDSEISGVNFVLSENGTDVGVFRLIMDENAATADRIAFAQDTEEGDKEFFFRAVLYKLSLGAPITLRIPGFRPELTQFGFERKGAFMEVVTSVIRLTGKCSGGK